MLDAAPVLALNSYQAQVGISGGAIGDGLDRPNVVADLVDAPGESAGAVGDGRRRAFCGAGFGLVIGVETGMSVAGEIAALALFAPAMMKRKMSFGVVASPESRTSGELNVGSTSG